MSSREEDGEAIIAREAAQVYRVLCAQLAARRSVHEADWPLYVTDLLAQAAAVFALNETMQGLLQSEGASGSDADAMVRKIGASIRSSLAHN